MQNDIIEDEKNEQDAVITSLEVKKDEESQEAQSHQVNEEGDVHEEGEILTIAPPEDEHKEEVQTIDISPCIRYTYEDMVWFAIMVASFFAVKPFFYTLVLPMLSDESQIRTLIMIVNGSIYLIAAIAMFNLAKATHKMLYHNLKVTPHHIEFRQGILNTKSTKINVVKIRAVDVEQTLAQKALNIGTVSFASASTDGYEIVVKGVYKPYQLRAYIKHRIGVLAYEEAPGTVSYP